tara:strand:+ start:748 stop:1584 length:837 start_codon:yes stop_codon:yes gene_type:complete
MITDWLPILLWPFLISLLLVSTHTFFGLHVLARGIIFVDLALAQVSALGGIIALIIWGEEAEHYSFPLGLIFTFVAALFLTFLRRIDSKTTREVSIGCLYVFSMALSVVILSKSPHGGEELKALLNGNILWITQQQIIRTSLISIIALYFLYKFRRKFYSLSFDPSLKLPHPFLWEFAFFILFALIISTAVQVVGVLMVFAYLILPAFAASIIVKTFRNQFILGWLLGVITTTAGGIVSLMYDLPTGATIVTLLGLLPVICFMLSIPFFKKHKISIFN